MTGFEPRISRVRSDHNHFLTFFTISFDSREGNMNPWPRDWEADALATTSFAAKHLILIFEKLARNLVYRRVLKMLCTFTHAFNFYTRLHKRLKNIKHV